MSEVFLKLLNLSITASWLILAVVIIRPLIKKAPKWINCALWALVALRLVCPFSFESALSLIPNTETVPYDIAMKTNPAIDSGIPVVNSVINPVIADGFTPDPLTSANPLQIVIPVVSIVWIAGMVTMMLYALISFIRLKKSVGASIAVRDNIMACDEVRSPFILGIFKPMIYVPSSIAGETLDCVITHENAHIKRHDHWWKPLGYLLLTVYWFNPFCWVAYILLCRDIEMACDEKVIRNMDKEGKAAYSQALLNCNFPRKKIAACPLAFGEVGVKERVKSVLNYKKPAFWIIIVAVMACIVVGVCFLTSPKAEKDTITYVHKDTAIGQRADFNVDIGRNVTSAELIAEMWQNGQCTSSSPVIVTSQTEKITLLFNDRRENLDLIGENIQIDTDETAGSLVTYFAFPERVVGWSFTSWKDAVNVPVKAGEDVILAAMACDMGSGVRSIDCQSLTIEPERLSSADCLIVIRAKFYCSAINLDDNTLAVSENIQDASKWFDSLNGDEMMWDGIREINLDEYPGVTFRWHSEKLEAITDKETITLYSGMPIWSVYFCDLNNDGKPELCSTLSIGSGIIDNRIIVYDYAMGASYELSDRGQYDYTLNMQNGKLMVEKRGYSQEELLSSGELAFRDNTYQIIWDLDNKTAFELEFSGNTSLQHHFVLTEEEPYWNIWIENEGDDTIVIEIEGRVYKIEARTSKLIASENAWKAGPYAVSFASLTQFGMQGRAICMVSSMPQSTSG